jgi:hypothetical protein
MTFLTFALSQNGARRNDVFNGFPFSSTNSTVACQIATIRFGRGRRPRGPTYARGTIRSLFENQELAR